MLEGVKGMKGKGREGKGAASERKSSVKNAREDLNFTPQKCTLIPLSLFVRSPSRYHSILQATRPP